MGVGVAADRIEPQAPTSASNTTVIRYHNNIRRWVSWLGDTHCFCPAKAEMTYSTSNITHYISTPGTDMGAADESPDVQSVLRVRVDSKSQRSVESLVGELISSEFGAELQTFCHFGKEASIIPLVLRDMLAMQVDLRPILYRAPIYDSKKHITKLALQDRLPGLCARSNTQPGPLLQEFAWTSVSNSVMANGYGINMWGLLTLASMIGCTEIHCKNSSRMASSVLSCIMSIAPAASTPGKLIPVRSFNPNTTTHEYVPVTLQPGRSLRNEHFIRPSKDDSFARGGIHTFCPVTDGMAPEDYLGCGHVAAMAKLLCCKFIEVPAKHLKGFYQLVPGRYYALYKHPHERNRETREGTLMIGKTGVEIMHWTKGEREVGEGAGGTVSFLKWHDELRDRELLVLPMVFRQGAAVWAEDKIHVGCLVTHGTRRELARARGSEPDENEFVSNFDHVNHCYCAQMEESDYEQIDPEEVIDRLIPPGTTLWLKPYTVSWDNLHAKFPLKVFNEGETDNRALAVRLDFPPEDDYTPGQLCVIILERKPGTLRMQEPEYEHHFVDPWELVAVGTEGYTELRELEQI